MILKILNKIIDNIKKYQLFIIWILVPLSLFLLPLIVRLFLIDGYYFTHASFSLGFVNLYFMIYHYRHEHNSILYKFGMILPVFLLSLTTLDYLSNFYSMSLANVICEKMKSDPGVQEALGIANGFGSIFVFLIAIKVGSHLKSLENILPEFRTIVGMSAFFSIITTMGLFGMQAPYTVKWIFQIVIVGGGLFVGVFSFALGILYGNSKNAVLSILGIFIVFIVGLIFGIAVIVFTGTGERLLLSQFSFAANLNLIIGLFLYTLEVSENPWKKYLMRILDVTLD